jgi:hypothetical protein
MRLINLLFIILLATASYVTIAQPVQTQYDQTEINFSINPELGIYKIHPALYPGDLPSNVEIVGGIPGKYHKVLATEHSLNEIIRKGYYVELLQEETASLSYSYGNEYHTLEEMIDFLNSTADNYQEITQLISIGKSYEDRDIWCMEISDNPGVNENEPGILFMGLHHAREWPTLEICIGIIKELTEGYQQDDTITSLIDNRRIWIIPCVNPDGYYFSHDLGNDFRKNRHYLDEYNSYGIDLNRNYGGSTNGNPLGSWGSTGMSHNPYDEIYCGSMPFSELETNAIRQFFLSQDICASISWHTSGELVMWPWGYSLDHLTPDNEYLSQVGTEIASRIQTQTGSGAYFPTQSAGLYPTTGDTTDWMYGYSHYVLGKPLFTYTIEACDSFHPSPDVLPQIVDENVDGAIYLLQEAEHINALQPRVLPPVIKNITANEDQTYHIEWNVLNPLSAPENFEIRQFSNINIDVDNTNDIDVYWDTDGFVTTTRYAFSCGNSYYPFPGRNKVSSMTTKYPIPIKRGMNLSFYTIYEIEKDRDRAFVEISTDGRNYQVLDTFTGFSTTWEKKEYSLSEFVGQSLFIRFRYSTDIGALENGFFIDDIHPVVTYDAIAPLQNTFSNSVDISIPPTKDIMFYQVRGYNEKYGWGDWSMLYPSNNSFFYGKPPNPPIIDGPVEALKGDTISYSITSYDSDGDLVSYYIKWGDGVCSEWLGPYPSNQTIIVNHTWNTTGNFIIEIRVMDETGLLSEWTYHEITLSKNKIITFSFLEYIKDWIQWFRHIFLIFFY